MQEPRPADAELADLLYEVGQKIDRIEQLNKILADDPIRDYSNAIWPITDDFGLIRIGESAAELRRNVRELASIVKRYELIIMSVGLAELHGDFSSMLPAAVPGVGI
ncbi:MAG: hypothetical protein IT426_20945 [Pirellulales bacterium]|nr:hypothetical protein [Pirellulales bacterium]